MLQDPLVLPCQMPNLSLQKNFQLPHLKMNCFLPLRQSCRLPKKKKKAKENPLPLIRSKVGSRDKPPHKHTAEQLTTESFVTFNNTTVVK